MIFILKIFVKIMEMIIVFAMVNAVLFSYFRTEDEKKKRIGVILSLSLGIVLTVVLTVVRSIPNFVNRTHLSFYTMLPVVISLVFLLIMIGVKESLFAHKEKIFENIFMFFTIIYVAFSFAYYLPGIFSQDKFVYYGEAVLSTMVLFRIIGYSLALLVTVLSCIGVYKTTSKLSLKEAKVVVFFTMFIFGITQIFVVIQRLYSINIIPKNDLIFKAIAWVDNNTIKINFIIMIFLAFLPILLFSKNVKVKEKYDNKAQLRKIRYLMRRKRNLSLFFMCMIAVNILSVSVIKSYANREIELSAPEEYKIENGMAEVPLSVLEDGHLHRYSYDAPDGIHMRFFLIQKSEGNYGVVLDACDICGSSGGYFERGNDVICKACDVVMNRGTIGFKGGCNPIPIPYRIHDEKVKIDLKDLDSNSYIFK